MKQYLDLLNYVKDNGIKKKIGQELGLYQPLVTR